MKKSVVFIGLCLLVAQFISAQQNENVFTYKVGNFKVSLLSEGQGKGNPRIFVGATQEMMDKTIPDGTFPNATNAFVIQTGEKNILIDTGHGRLLFDNLKSLNISPEQIDIILITHMHGDHINGLLSDGLIAFPNASVYIAQPEYDYWNSQDGNAKKVIEAYKSKLKIFQPEQLGAVKTELVKGIYPIASYGHTPGHTSFLIGSTGKKLLVWGDLTHAMAIQMPYPEVAMTYDIDPQQAIVSRKEILKYITEQKIPIAGMHIAYPSIGHITQAGTGYTFTPVR